MYHDSCGGTAARTSEMNLEQLSKLATPLDKYATVLEALSIIADARDYQVSVAWKDVALPDAGGRSSEEWLCLLQHAQNKLMGVYYETPGSTLEGLKRMQKYAGIQANLALWLVQATAGAVQEFQKKAEPGDQGNGFGSGMKATVEDETKGADQTVATRSILCRYL